VTFHFSQTILTLLFLDSKRRDSLPETWLLYLVI